MKSVKYCQVTEYTLLALTKEKAVFLGPDYMKNEPFETLFTFKYVKKRFTVL